MNQPIVIDKQEMISTIEDSTLSARLDCLRQLRNGNIASLDQLQDTLNTNIEIMEQDLMKKAKKSTIKKAAQQVPIVEVAFNNIHLNNVKWLAEKEGAIRELQNLIRVIDDGNDIYSPIVIKSLNIIKYFASHRIQDINNEISHYDVELGETHDAIAKLFPELGQQAEA